MKINFLLPTQGHHPVGGYKVVYEYANGLAAQGHDVIVTHRMINVPGRGRGRQWLRYAKMKIKGDWLPVRWFEVDARVKMRLAICLTPQSIGAADVVVATSWDTAEVAAELPASCGRKYYFIQHFEEWSGDRERVLATWRLPLQKIVIAEWLRKIALDEDQTAYYIPNGVDFNAFGIDTPIEQRDPHTAMMLYHNFDWKGSSDGIEALRIVKKAVPDLKVILFGVQPKPEGLEPWFEYHMLPTQPVLRQLYNRASIFLSPSLAEGWPLPPAEAMISGAATVLTNIGGHQEYGIEGKTTRFCKVRNPQSLSDALLSLILNNEERVRQAVAARKFMERFKWETAIKKFESAISA